MPPHPPIPLWYSNALNAIDNVTFAQVLKLSLMVLLVVLIKQVRLSHLEKVLHFLFIVGRREWKRWDSNSKKVLRLSKTRRALARFAEYQTLLFGMACMTYSFIVISLGMLLSAFSVKPVHIFAFLGCSIFLFICAMGFNYFLTEYQMLRYREKYNIKST